MASTPPPQSRPPSVRQCSGLGLVPAPIPVVPSRTFSHVPVAVVAVPQAAPQRQLSGTTSQPVCASPVSLSGRLQRSMSARATIVHRPIPQPSPVSASRNIVRCSSITGLPCVAAQTASETLQQKEAETESTVPSTPASRLGHAFILDSSSAGGLLNTSTSAAGPDEESLQRSSLGFQIRTQYARSQTPPPALRMGSGSPSRAACTNWNLTPSGSSVSAPPLQSRTSPPGAFRPLHFQAAVDPRDEVDGTSIGHASNHGTTSPLLQQTSEGAEQPLATAPLGPTETWRVLDGAEQLSQLSELAAETWPGNQRQTSEEGSPVASLATAAPTTAFPQPVATRDVAEHVGSNCLGINRDLEETCDALQPPTGDEERLANSEASRPGNFAVGDVVRANGRLGVVFWDGRPRHDYAMLVWNDDGTESGVRASEICKVQPETRIGDETPCKAAASSSPQELQGPPSFEGRLIASQTTGHRNKAQQQLEQQPQLKQLEHEQPLDETREVTLDRADLTGLSDALSFGRLSNRVAALDQHNQRLRGWRVGVGAMS